MSIVLFIKCGYPLLVNDMREIIHKKEKIEKQKQKNNTTLLGNRRLSRLNANKNTANKIRKRKTKVIDQRKSNRERIKRLKEN